jgi:hypothetical protein
MKKQLDPKPQDDDIAKVIERTYTHGADGGELSAWHVREALRLLHLRIKHIEENR